MDDFHTDVEPPPSDRDLDMLTDVYPSYKEAHRSGIVEAIANDGSVKNIVAAKLFAKGIVSTSNQSLGGHMKWGTKKLRRAAIRMCYLRLVMNEQLTRRQANQVLLKKFGSDSAQDGGQSNIRKATQNTEKI